MCDDFAMATQQRRGVHLFRGDILVGHRTTTESSPDEYYEVEGVTYVATVVRGPFLEHDGGEGWDVQVEPLADND